MMIVKKKDIFLLILCLSICIVHANAQSYNLSVCSGSDFTFKSPDASSLTTYTWNVPYIIPSGTIINGQDQQAPENYVYGNLTNNSPYPATAIYNVTTSDSVEFQLFVTVNPTPLLSSNLNPASVCGASIFNYTPVSQTDAVNFSWSRNAVVGISNPAASGVDNPAETLINTTDNSIPVIYNYQLEANGCSSAQQITINVNPIYKLTSTLNPGAICSSTKFSYNPTSNTNAAIFSWKRAAISGINNPAASGLGNPNETLINKTAGPINVTYQYAISAGGCSNTQNVVVSIIPEPLVTNIPSANSTVCTGSNFVYTPQFNIANTNYTWKRAPVANINGGDSSSGQGPINELLVNSIENPIRVSYNFSFSSSSSGCNSTQQIRFFVNPKPVIPNLATQIITCTGNSFLVSPTQNAALNTYVPINTQYTWTVVQTPNNSGASSVNTLQPYISQKLTNNTNTPITLDYIVTPNAGGCIGADFRFSVQINTTNKQLLLANLNPYPNGICSGTPVNYTPISLSGPLTYRWKRLFNTDLPSNPTATGNTNIVNDILINNATKFVPVDYLYTLSDNTGCTNLQIVHLVVNPTDSITNPLLVAPICTNNIVDFQPTKGNPTTNFTWTRTANPGINNNQTTTGTNVKINETLQNSSTAPINVQYSFRLTTAEGCVNNSQKLFVTVNPQPILSSSLTPGAVCSETIFNYTPVSPVIGSVFNWTRPSVTNISNPTASGFGNPLETLVDTSLQSISVVYNYNITANGCTNNQSVTVLVNPIAKLAALSNQINTICSNEVFEIDPQNVPVGTKYLWTPGISNPLNAIISLGNPNVAATKFSERIFNSSKYLATATYTITTISGTCNGPDVTVSVQVNPAANLPDLQDSICSSINYVKEFTDVPKNTSFTWGLPVIDSANVLIGANSSIDPSSNFTQQLKNTSLFPAVATYQIIPKTGNCLGNTFQINLKVKPEAILNDTIISAVCSGINFNTIPNNIPDGTLFTWNANSLIPANGLTGQESQIVPVNSINGTLFSTNNISDSALYTVTPVTNSCIGQSFVLTVPVSPVPQIADIADSTCSDIAFINLPINVPANTQYSWPMPQFNADGNLIGASASTGLTDTISQVLINKATIPSLVTYTVTPNTGGCIGNPFVISKTVISSIPKLAPITTLNCSNTAFNIIPSNMPIGIQYSWQLPVVSTANLLIGFNSSNGLQPSINQLLINKGTILDSAIYQISTHLLGCNGNDFELNALVIAPPKATITGLPIVCASGSDTVYVHFTGTGPWSFTYTNNNETLTQSGLTNPDFVWHTVEQPNETAHNYSITYIKDNVCENVLDTSVFIQEIKAYPKAEIKATNGSYICDNVNEKLYVHLISGEVAKYQWLFNNNPIVGENADSIIVKNTGSYNAIITSSFGCSDASSLPIAVTYIAKPNVHFSIDKSCINIPITFTNLSDTLNSGIIKWHWTLDDNVFKSTTNTSYTYSTGGSRNIKLIAEQLNCPTNRNEVDSIVNIAVPVQGIQLPSVSTSVGQNTILNARVFSNYNYTWTPANFLSDANSTSPTFNSKVFQNYLINMESPEGCITVDSLTVRVFEKDLQDIFVPKSFTPNHDGVNDILYPYLSGIKEFKYFRIFNRYGQLVFETRNPDNGWDGLFKGVEQTMSVYIWVAEGLTNDGKLIQKKGETLLLR